MAKIRVCTYILDRFVDTPLSDPTPTWNPVVAMVTEAFNAQNTWVNRFDRCEAAFNKSRGIRKKREGVHKFPAVRFVPAANEWVGPIKKGPVPGFWHSGIGPNQRVPTVCSARKPQKRYPFMFWRDSLVRRLMKATCLDKMMEWIHWLNSPGRMVHLDILRLKPVNVRHM
ncbi:hypothetical protein LY76DRAFT_610210 [Colletotrichum caudatum]|nr:hypothetical protein LY76DRAFT_610210 [Colletotrichum caudatum]